MIKIVTHTRGSGPWFDQCVRSVEAARVPDMDHDILLLNDPVVHAEARLTALQSAEFVGFVDDDDLIEPGAIHTCMKALEATGAGVAFTSQIGIDESGVKVSNYNRARFAMDIAMNPQALHHFALIRREALCVSTIIEAMKIGIGIDWLCKANAAMRMGAVYVPMIGYQWRIHSNQESVRTAARFAAASNELTETILSWIKRNDPIPVHQC